MRHTLNYTQLLVVEKNLTTDLTLNLLFSPRVAQLLKATKHQRESINARWNKIKEKYIQTDAAGNLLTININGQEEWVYLERLEIDGVTHVGAEVAKAFSRESEKFLNNNKIVIDI